MKLADLALNKNIKYHNELNPKLWTSETLKADIRRKLIEIGEAFLEFLDVDEKALIDYRIVGSCANYNWSEFSDIDLHVILDYHIVGQTCNDQLVEDFLFTKRALWLERHDIKVVGLQVEVGPQDKDAPLESLACYSLLENEWIKKPKHKEPDIDEKRYMLKVVEMKKRIDTLLANKDASSEDFQKVREELKEMRKRGLAKGGEFNADNLAFKSLRNQGYLEKLENRKNSAQSKELSL